MFQNNGDNYDARHAIKIIFELVSQRGASGEVADGECEADGKSGGGSEFAARRLSVHNPYDEDWNEVGEDGGELAPRD